MPENSRDISRNDQEEEEVGLISARSPNPGRFSKWTLSRVALGLVLGLACAAWMLRGEKDIEGVTNSSLPQQKYSGLNGATGPMPPVPKKANEHNGIEWPEMTLGGDQTMTFFIVGDWGGMDGAIIPPNGATRMVQYNGGKEVGPHVFAHRPSGCNDQQMSICFNARGGVGCPVTCGYNDSVDYEPALLVANQMKKRAKTSHPQFVLNVGDNFYWGGIPLMCGANPLAGIHYITGHMFDTIYNQIYNTPELNIAWLSVLGNHDYGGWMFSASWDQQIAYTWHNPKWRLPAQYWMQHVNFVDKGFDMDILLLDSNNEDAAPSNLRQNTNLCSAAHNPPGANCAAVGGPDSIDSCPLYFANLWLEQQHWTYRKLNASKATWQVLVTHFPCGHQDWWYKKLHKEFGLDLVVTGHTHIQLTHPMGGLMCVISGGGGGILSEVASHGDDSNSYGFYEATITRDEIKLELINFAGRSLGTWKVHHGKGAPSHHEEIHSKKMSKPKRMEHSKDASSSEHSKEDQDEHTTTKPLKIKKPIAEPARAEESKSTLQDQLKAKIKELIVEKEKEKEEQEEEKKEEEEKDEEKEEKEEKEDEEKEEAKGTATKESEFFGKMSPEQKRKCGLWCKLLHRRLSKLVKDPVSV